MSRVRRLISLAAIFCTIGCSANSLTPAQQQRADLLYTKFVAPCCWRQSVAVHQSPEAFQVRRLIDSEILAGQSDAQVEEGLVRTYGHGILMEPKGIRALAAYGMPVLFVIAALFGVVRWLRIKLLTTTTLAIELSLPPASPDLELPSNVSGVGRGL